MRHAISWFELPVTDLHRAAAFYTAILGADLTEVAQADDRRGGRVLLPRMEMGEWGVAAFIVDTEGNKVALHAMA